MLECIEILSIATEKGLHMYAVKGNWRLDSSIQSKIIAMAFAIVAEIERDLISQRTTEALQARKQQGMPLGRPKGVGKSKLDAYRTEVVNPNNPALAYDRLTWVQQNFIRAETLQPCQCHVSRCSGETDPRASMGRRRGRFR